MGSPSSPNETLVTARAGRRSWRLWLVLGLLAYCGFVAICFYMESEARTRFKVPSKADIEATTDRVTRVRTESARNNALADMRSWTPYAAYSIAMGIVVFGGTAVATVLGTVAIWRGVRRDSVRKAKYILFAIMMVTLISMAALAWPSFVAGKRYEARPTSFGVGAQR